MQKVYMVLKHYKGLGITASSKKKKKSLHSLAEWYLEAVAFFPSSCKHYS